MAEDVDNLRTAYRFALVRANKTLNLVSRQGVNKIIPSLITESVAVLDWKLARIESPLLDIGSGGGFPGIPLKISKPELAMTLLDSNRKKTLFLRQVIEKLELRNIDVVWTRFEEFSAVPDNSRKFRTITARGVGQIELLLKAAKELLQSGGELIVWTNAGSLPDSVPEGFSKPQSTIVAQGLMLVRWERKVDSLLHHFDSNGANIAE